MGAIDIRSKYDNGNKINSVSTMPPGRGVASSKNFRVVVMGTAGVGKTSIISHLLHEEFTDNHKETIEELHHHVVKFNNVSAEIDILDTSGTYQFPGMRKLAIATGDAFVLVYSVENGESFETVKALRDEIKEGKPKSKYSIVVVANKTDLEKCDNYDHAVTESVVCMDWEEKFVAASAKTGDNVENVLLCLESKIKERVKLEEKRLTFLRRISLPVMKIAKSDRSQKPFLKSKSRTSSFES